MEKLRSKKGSTLVMLIISVGIISLLGTSILGVTMMNYKIKKANTDLKHTFYMSETGLDKAYDRAYKLVLEAVNEGSAASQDFINELTDEISTLNSAENEAPPTVKDAYRDYIIIGTDKPFIAEPNEAEIKIRASEIFNTTYENYMDAFKINQTLDSSFSPYDSGVEVEVEYSKWDNDTGRPAKRILTIGIRSSYISEYTKRVSASLIIGIPDYEEPFTVETKIVPVHKLWTYGIAADNIIIGNNSYNGDKVTVSGDVYAGVNLEINGRNTEAYFDKTLIAAGSTIDNYGILLKGAGSSLRVKDVFAKNIIMSGTGASFTTYPNSRIYVKDDLEMNNTAQTTDIDGSYYGFSPGGEQHEVNTLNSALIINSPDIASGGSRFNISGDLVLYGTSYIKGTPYATGESVSIPGNYIAYTRPLSGGSSEGKSLTWDNIITQYYDPLPPLAYSFRSGGDMWVWNKADYFIQYSREHGTGLNLGGGNITVGGNIETLGTGLNGTEIKTSSFNLEFLEKINNKNTYRTIYEERAKNYYDADFKAKVSSNHMKQRQGSELIYIDDDDVVIDDGIYDGHFTDRGIIVTNGDIVINGEFNFKGSIIAGGDIIISSERGKAVNIIHDGNYAAKLIAENNLYNTLFSEGDAGSFAITVYKNSSSAKIDFKNYIDFRDWKIE
ncbi:hypothetical protein [Sedimentibacter sp.]|uniref:hypothetical protein n=1 Tax=Sedimentibacter sp. TaxID=1960295 RepID=UPI0028AA81B4|nr:hypothetical protein [Sedimentibacter sp.]